MILEQVELFEYSRKGSPRYSAMAYVISVWRNHQCFETREKRIFLNTDGLLINSADTPNCPNGTTIDLIG